jgi:hypothetical protein
VETSFIGKAWPLVSHHPSFWLREPLERNTDDNYVLMQKVMLWNLLKTEEKNMKFGIVTVVSIEVILFAK